MSTVRVLVQAPDVDDAVLTELEDAVRNLATGEQKISLCNFNVRVSRFHTDSEHSYLFMAEDCEDLGDWKKKIETWWEEGDVLAVPFTMVWETFDLVVSWKDEDHGPW